MDTKKDKELNEIMKTSQDMKVEFELGGQTTLSHGSPKTILLIRYLHGNS